MTARAIVHNVIACLTCLLFISSSLADDCSDINALQDIKQNLDTLIELSSGCQSDDECLTLVAACEFGCKQAVNRQSMPLILEALDSYQQLLCTSCSRNCNADQTARCISGQCQTTPQVASQHINTPFTKRPKETASSTPISEPARTRSKFGIQRLPRSSSIAPQPTRRLTASSTLMHDNNHTASSTIKAAPLNP